MNKNTQDNQPSQATSSVKASDKASAKKYPRLPCRGCLASCKNYDVCDGKLWRMAK